MTFDDFVAAGWKDHATDAEGVLARLPESLARVNEPRHLSAFAALAVHVAGEHLGRWAQGLTLLDRLEALPVFDALSPEGKSVIRSKAVLHRCAGNREAEERCLAASLTGGDVPEASDRVRMLAVAAAAFLGQKRMAEARRDFDEAVSLAAYGPTASDPAARSLAVTGNNLACAFEEMPALTEEQRGMMVRAAQVARRFWGIAGGWKEAERAEYRLAMSYVKAGDPVAALAHAAQCLSIVMENGSDPGEAFFAHEAIARAHLSAGDIVGAARERALMAAGLPSIADESFGRFCREELAKFDQVLPRG